MKKTAFLLAAAFCVSPVFSTPSHGMNVDVPGQTIPGKVILIHNDISADSDWASIDLSPLNPRKDKIGSLYLQMFLGVASSCAGDSIQFLVRPFGSTTVGRIQFGRSNGDPANGNEHVQYVWIPINNNKLEYKVESIACPDASVDVMLSIVGYERKDPNRWRKIYR